MTSWLLQRLAFDPHAYVHKPEASFAHKTESEAIQEFARQFADRPDKCVGKLFVVSNAERVTRRFWIASDLRVTDLEASEPKRIIARGFCTTHFQEDLREMPTYVTAVAVMEVPNQNRVLYGAASIEDARDRAALLCLENFVRIEIHQRRSFLRVGRVTMTDAGPAFTLAHTPDAQPVPIRPRQVDEVLKYAGLQGQTISSI